jgi:PKD domain
MIPTAANSDYPKFVPDQVLTSDNLNDLFGYLDEQGRITRTNLSGIGIVCGLQVKTAADGSSITITQGVGVTSSGYLVSVSEVIYTKRTTTVFDAVKCEYYDKFVNIGAKTQKFDLWELKQEAEAEGTTVLNNSFLTDKVVLIFVELLEENNKNCDPNSCDDKGVKVTVTFRPLLVEKANVAGLLAGTGTVSPWLSLPDISMRRFNVTATPVYECLNIFDSYRKILNSAFLVKTQSALTQAYNTLQPALAVDFPANPFATLANDFEFLHDGSITSGQLIAMQYYYDLFSDLLQAYKEVKEKGTAVIGMCCPDDLFPRHLLLDLAIPDTTQQLSCYRHYFIPSPILSDEQKCISELVTLFKKLVLLQQKFLVPPMAIPQGGKTVDSNIRITPSLLADIAFSKKSIPYYYNIVNAADPLLKNWNPEKLKAGKTERNLSYHATKYNATDDEIRRPLLYDLESYNFLRIEGHIGKPYAHVVKNIIALRDKNRLPFDVVALNADISSITGFIKNLGKLMTSGDAAAQATLEGLIGGNCHFNDLELLYDSIMAELTIKLSNEMKFFYDVKRDPKRTALPAPANNIPKVPLLVKTDASFRFTTNSIGHEFEIFYATVKNQPFISFPVFFQAFGQGNNTDVMDFCFKAVLYYIEMLYETVTTSLSSFNFFSFYTRYYTLIFTVRYIKLINKFFSEQFPLSEEENDHLDAILSIAADGRMIQLYYEFLLRVVRVKVMQQAGFYFTANPGVQHKAGVPVGGTFIVVYHEAEQAEVAEAAAEEVVAAARTEAAAFNVAGEATSKTATFSKTTFEASASPAEHIENMSAGITEKVTDAGQRIVLGLRQSLTNTKTKVLATVAEKASAAPNAADAAAAKNSNTEMLKYLAEAAAYLKNRQDDELDEAIADFNNGIVIADFYLPYLCCSDCPPIQMLIGAEPEKPNQPPVARPGDNVSVQLPVDIVTLDGSTSSDPDGSIKTYLWEIQSGPGATIETAGESKTKVSALKEGVYIFKLTVTDDDGATNSATVTVTVLPKPNTPPVAVASANPNTVTLSQVTVVETQLSSLGSSDPDGDTITFNWSLPAGTTGATIITPNAPGSRVQFSVAGVYVFTLKVTDSKGAVATATVAVTVNPRPNTPPVAVASANPTVLTLSQATVTQTQLSSAGSSDPDGDPITVNWSLPAGTAGANILSPNAANTIVQFTAAGVYVFTLKVTDSRNAVTTATVTVAVNPRPNRVPIAVATVTPAQATLSANNTATAVLSSAGSSDPDGDPLTFQWSLPAAVQGATIQAPTNPSTGVIFTVAGTFVFTLIVKDNKGGTASKTVTVVINPRPNLGPTARAAITPTTLNLVQGQTTRAQLNGTQSTDPEGDPLTFLWSLPAGVTGATIVAPTKVTTMVTFNRIGNYTFTLRVTDSNNNFSTTQVTISVLPVPG